LVNRGWCETCVDAAEFFGGELSQAELGSKRFA
jgi:hypothetical protein